MECKHWKSRISKLHVLALQEIVLTVGADRGILLSESRFQTGAIEAPMLTNIRVTSLDDVQRSASSEIVEMRLRELYDRVESCRDQYWDIPKEIRIEHGLRPKVGAWGYSSTRVLELASDLLTKAFRGTYPIGTALEALVTLGFPREFLTSEDVLAVLEPMSAELEGKL